MMARGLSREDIAKELGCSPATAGRRMAAVKSGVPSARAVLPPILSRPAPPPAPKADGPLPAAEDVTEETPLELIDRWLERAERMAVSSTEEAEVATATRLAATLLGMKLKHTPVDRPDPNDHPDFVEAAASARKKLHDRLDAIAREHRT